jgi:hypothetical protein
MPAAGVSSTWYVTIFDSSLVGEGTLLSSQCSLNDTQYIGKPGYIYMGCYTYYNGSGVAGWQGGMGAWSGPAGHPTITPLSAKAPAPGFTCAFDYINGQTGFLTTYPSNSDQEVITMTSGSLGVDQWVAAKGSASLDRNDRGSLDISVMTPGSSGLILPLYIIVAEQSN